jgi:uncharacterized membrane protein YphA (DoxX/SURF4 family)
VFIVAAIFSVLLAVAIVGAGLPKLMANRKSLDIARHVGASPSLWRIIGGLELAAAAGLIIGLWVAWLGILAALGLVLLMAGALFFHQRVNDPPKAMAPPASIGVVALLTVILRTASG